MATGLDALVVDALCDDVHREKKFNGSVPQPSVYRGFSPAGRISYACIEVQ